MCYGKRENPNCFWWRSKVIWGHQGSKSEKLGLISYLVCWCIMVRERTLIVLVEVKGHRGQTLKALLTPYLDVGSLVLFFVFRCVIGRLSTLLVLVEVKGHLGSPGVKPWKPRSLSGVTRGQKGKFPKCSQDLYLRSPQVKKQNFPRIPKAFILGHHRSKSKIFQEFTRSSSGSPKVKKQNFPRIPKIKYEHKTVFFQHLKIAFHQWLKEMG